MWDKLFLFLNLFFSIISVALSQIPNYEWTRTYYNSPPSPPARDDHSAIYTNYDTMIIFGGQDSLNYYNDAWEYDFIMSSWIQFTVTSYYLPISRISHTAIYANSNKMIMFAGTSIINGNTYFLNDIWEFNTSNAYWTQLAPSNPLPPYRCRHTAIYTDSNTMIIFGGYDLNYIWNDLWEYNISANSWTQLNLSSPLPSKRYSHSAIYTNSNTMLVFGGTDGAQVFNDLWEYKISANSWTQLNPSSDVPYYRYKHGAIYTNSNTMIIYGGNAPQYGYFNDMWAYYISLNVWYLLSPTAQSLSMLYIGGFTIIDRPYYYFDQNSNSINLTDSIVLFGGTDEFGYFYNRLYVSSFKDPPTYTSTYSGTYTSTYTSNSSSDWVTIVVIIIILILLCCPEVICFLLFASCFGCFKCLLSDEFITFVLFCVAFSIKIFTLISPILLIEQILTILVVNALENDPTWFAAGIVISFLLIIEELLYELGTFIEEKPEENYEKKINWLELGRNLPFFWNMMTNLAQIIIVLEASYFIDYPLIILFIIFQVLELILKFLLYVYQKFHPEKTVERKSPLFKLKIILMFFYFVLGLFFLVGEGIQDSFYSSTWVNIYFVVCLHISRGFFSIDVMKNLIYFGCVPSSVNINAQLKQLYRNWKNPNYNPKMNGNEIDNSWKKVLEIFTVFAIYSFLVYSLLFFVGFSTGRNGLVIFNGIMFVLLFLLLIVSSILYLRKRLEEPDTNSINLQSYSSNV